MLAAVNDHRKSCLFGLRFLMICDHGTTDDSAELSLGICSSGSHIIQSHKSNEETYPCSDDGTNILSTGIDKNWREEDSVSEPKKRAFSCK